MIVSGTVTNTSKFETKVKLDGNNQIIKAVAFNGMVKVGTKVLVFSDKENDTFFIVNTFMDGMDEILNVLKEFLVVVKSLKTIDESAYAPAKGFWGHDKTSDIESLIQRIDKFLN